MLGNSRPTGFFFDQTWKSPAENPAALRLSLPQKMPMRFTFQKNYFVATVLLFLIEVAIALFVRDKFIRPYVEKEWTIIFNKTAEQWGAYNYDASKDVLRVTVPSKVVSNASETMEFMLDGSALVLHWDRLTVPVRIKG